MTPRWATGRMAAVRFDKSLWNWQLRGYAPARKRGFGRKRDVVGASGFFQRALQRVLVRAGAIHHLIYLGFGDFIRENAADAHAALVHM